MGCNKKLCFESSLPLFGPSRGYFLKLKSLNMHEILCIKMTKMSTLVPTFIDVMLCNLSASSSPSSFRIKSSSFEVWGTLINILRFIAAMLRAASIYIASKKSRAQRSNPLSRTKLERARVCQKLIRMN